MAANLSLSVKIVAGSISVDELIFPLFLYLHSNTSSCILSTKAADDNHHQSKHPMYSSTSCYLRFQWHQWGGVRILLHWRMICEAWKGIKRIQCKFQPASHPCLRPLWLLRKFVWLVSLWTVWLLNASWLPDCVATMNIDTWSPLHLLRTIFWDFTC